MEHETPAPGTGSRPAAGCIAPGALPAGEGTCLPQGGVVLIIGSAPDAARCRDWPRGAFDRIVAINNAWRIRPDWDVMIHPFDFPVERRPAAAGPGQVIISDDEFVPVQNAYGGFLYAGATMAFTSAYWVLGAMAPRTIAFLGCNMHYPTHGPTHFYGTGAPDPLRGDITLQSLEAKAARFGIFAARAGTAVVNLSPGPARLVYPQGGFADARMLDHRPARADAALAAEAALGYHSPSGRYWEELHLYDPAKLAAIDALWLASLP